MGTDLDADVWTSLAYVAAGAVLSLDVARGRLARSAGALAAVTVAEGIGSALFHARPSDLAHVLHDAPLVGMVAYPAGSHLGRLLGSADRGALVGLTAGVVCGGVSTAVGPTATNALMTSAIATVVVGESLARARHLPPVWDARLGAVAALAAAVWLPAHGLWHVLTSILVAWARRSHAVDRFRRDTITG